GYVDIRQDRAMVHVAYGFAASDIALERRRQKHLGYPGDGLGVALAKALGEPALHVGAHHRGEAVLAREAQAVVPDLAVREMGAGVAEHHTLEALRRIGAEPHAFHAAHRQPAPIDLLEPEPVEHRECIAREPLHRIRPFGHTRAAMAAAIKANEPEMLPEGIE